MPIKFRCQQCRQFLGISRSKAGSVVDCPTCGRTIRIPDLDGTVRPLPKPGLDMQDSSLSRALDELASIGSPLAADADLPNDDEEFAAAAVSDSDQFEAKQSGDSDREQPGRNTGSRDAPVPEVVELEPLPPPDPIEMEPLDSKRQPPAAADFDDDSSAERAWKSTRKGGEDWKRLLADAELEGDSNAAPVKATESAAVPAAAQTAPAERVAESGPTVLRIAPSAWFAIVGVVALIFAAGFWAGRITSLRPDGPGDATAVSGADPTTGDPEASGSGTPQHEPAIRGRITWRAESGEIRPDRGARIIVLPAERSGSSLIPSTGVQSDAAQEDRRLTGAMIRELGGDFQTTDDSGEFSVQLPNAGKFHVLVLSNSLPREDGVDITDVQDVVARYFDRPPAVLGQVLFHLDEVQYSGTGTTPWDFSFHRS